MNTCSLGTNNISHPLRRTQVQVYVYICNPCVLRGLRCPLNRVYILCIFEVDRLQVSRQEVLAILPRLLPCPPYHNYPVPYHIPLTVAPPHPSPPTPTPAHGPGSNVTLSPAVLKPHHNLSSSTLFSNHIMFITTITKCYYDALLRQHGPWVVNWLPITRPLRCLPPKESPLVNFVNTPAPFLSHPNT